MIVLNGRHALTMLTLLGVACSSDRTPTGPRLSADVAGGTCTVLNPPRSTQRYAGLWPCGTQVQIYVQTSDGSDPSPYLGSVGSARTRWTTNLFNAYGLPTLKVPAGGTHTVGDGDRYVQVTVDLSRPGTLWCGVGSSRNVSLIRVASGQLCPADPNARVITSVADVATHELGHGIGFDHLSNAIGGPTASCIMAVPVTGSLNVTPCAHEKNLVYWIYGLRATEPDITAFLAQPGISLSPASVSLTLGATTHLSATVGGESELAPQLAWSAASSLVSIFNASDTGADLQAGQTEGQTTVTATIIDNPTISWPTNSSSASVVVQRPPVASIVIDPASVDLVGPTDATFIATVRDTEGNIRTDVSLTWTVDDPTVIYFVASGQSAWVSAKHNGWTTIRAVAPNGVTATALVYVEGCKVHCYA